MDFSLWKRKHFLDSTDKDHYGDFVCGALEAKKIGRNCYFAQKFDCKCITWNNKLRKAEKCSNQMGKSWD